MGRSIALARCVLYVAGHVSAQGAGVLLVERVERGRDTVSTRSQQASIDTGSADLPPLPVSRPLGQLPTIAETGIFSARDGAVTRAPAITALAVQDLHDYEGNLASLFPLGVLHYPADSLHALIVARANAWLTRLDIRPGTASLDASAAAMVAMYADRDTLARQIIDARLAHIPASSATTVVERSLLLATAVELFADPAQTEIRLARNLPIAMVYAEQLHALPYTRYATRHDSTDVQQRQWHAVAALFRAAEALHDPVLLLGQVDPFVTILARLPFDTRYDLVRWQFPYGAVADAMLQAPHGRARLDSLDTRLLRLTQRRPTEWPTDIPVERRADVSARERQTIRELMDAFAMIGRPAPPVRAHAWLHTSDSAYTSTPRTHDFADGIVRVLVFANRIDSRLALFEQVQHEVPQGVQVVLVTHTEGHAGPDLVSPADEVTWLNRFYTTTRHLSFPIALWAGEKLPQEAPLPAQASSGGNVNSGASPTAGQGSAEVRVAYQRALPAPSPTLASYDFAIRTGACVVIDGHGLIRALPIVSSRAQQASLIRSLTALRVSADSARARP